MCRIKVLLALNFLLATTYARPEGYGVKGGRNHKSTANAGALAQATAHANGGCLGICQSSATATATATASGGTSNAAATANASVDGGNIRKAISGDANRNANPLGDSDDLRLSSGYGKNSENQSNNQGDGTPVWDHITNAGLHGNTGNVGVTEQSQNSRLGCGVQAGVKGHRGGSGCTDKNIAEAKKPSVSNPFPTQHQEFGVATGSQYPIIDGGYGGNNAKPGSSCTPGDVKCIQNKPGISNLHPTYHTNPDLPTGSSNPVTGDGGYGGNNAEASPCTSGASGCLSNKPSVSNPHPTYHKNPDLSAGSEYPTSLDGGYGGNTANSGSRPCASGASGCSPNKPSVSNPHPTYNENPDLSASSKHSTSLDGGSGSNTANPESHPCSSGASGCSASKPSVLNPLVTYPGNADLSPNSQHTVSINYGKVEGKTENPEDTPCYPGDPRCIRNKPKSTTPDPATIGTIDSGSIPCASGAIYCSKDKPGVSNPHPTYEENPDLSGGSKYPTILNGGYGGKAPIAGANPSSGASGYPGSSGKTHTSNPFLNGEIDVSSIKHSGNPGESSEFPEIKTNPSNPFLHPHSQVRPPTGTKHPKNPNESYGGPPVAPEYPHGGSSGDSELPIIKQNPSNPFLSHHGNVDSTNGIKHPGISSGIPQQNTNLPSTKEHPAMNSDCDGSTSCMLNKSTGHPATPSEYPRKSPEYPNNKPNPSNPFLPHIGDTEKTTDIKHPDLTPPILKNPGSFGEGSYDRIDPHSNDKKNPGSLHAPNTSPGKEASDSNPFLVDGQLIKPHSQPGSHDIPSFPKPLPGHSSVDMSLTEPKPEVIHGNQGEISPTNCDREDLGDNDMQSSVTEDRRNKIPSSTENYGVKTYQSGVKGGSRRHGPPAQLQGSSELGKTDFVSGNKGPAYSTAHANASAGAYSSASSSSSSGGGYSSAKSEAYSDVGSSGSSNAWASSSASSSASAFASSSSYQGSANWEQPEIPNVPSE